MEWVYNIPSHTFKCEFMIDLSEIIRNIDLNRVQQQGYGHPLQLFMSRKAEERGKTTWGIPPSRKEKAQNLKHVFNYVFIFTRIG